MLGRAQAKLLRQHSQTCHFYLLSFSWCGLFVYFSFTCKILLTKDWAAKKFEATVIIRGRRASLILVETGCRFAKLCVMQFDP